MPIRSYPLHAPVFPTFRHLTWILAATIVMCIAGRVLAGFTSFSVGGNTTTASIQPTVDAFRTALGDPNNGNNPGPLASGRREINWDGGGATMSTSNASPLITFQNIRGGTFATPGTGFLQTPLTDMAFTNINPTYATTFNVFSSLRLFTPLGSNIVDATFSIPGTNGATTATVAGFGAVFSDVDLANTTSLQLFDVNDQPLAGFFAPAGTASNASLSFIGAIANAGERIARVRITTGNVALGPNDQNGDTVDVVVMDDFLYSEPVAVPEPAAAGLVGLLGCARLCARRRV